MKTPIAVFACQRPGHLFYRSHTLKLEPHEWLVVYTDGLIESFNRDDVPLDAEGVTKLLARNFSGARDVVDALCAGELHHRQGADPHDDLTILVFGFQ